MAGHSILLLFLVIQCSVLTQSKDMETVNFIKLFILNDQKPTHLIYGGLCWRKGKEINTYLHFYTTGVRLKSCYIINKCCIKPLRSVKPLLASQKGLGYSARLPSCEQQTKAEVG